MAVVGRSFVPSPQQKGSFRCQPDCFLSDLSLPPFRIMLWTGSTGPTRLEQGCPTLVNRERLQQVEGSK